MVFGHLFQLGGNIRNGSRFLAVDNLIFDSYLELFGAEQEPEGRQ